MVVTAREFKPWQIFGLSLLGVLGLTYGLYAAGLTGPLLLDDFWNLQPLGDAGGVHSLENLLQFVFANNSGPTGRPVSMLSFLIDSRDWPVDVAAFKYTNLMIHLLTGVVLCWFTLLLAQVAGLESSRAAAFGLIVAAFWLLHPLNVSTTLYVVQRMTQLMTLFSFAALICYLKGRGCIDLQPRRGLLLLCLALFPFGLLAVLSKENGALLLLYIVVIEATLLRGVAKSRLFSLWYRIGVLLPLLVVALYLVFSAPENLRLYDMRHFNLNERLLTEARILCLYLANILLPNTWGTGLYHDGFPLSTGLLGPITTLTSLAFLATLFGSACYLRRSQPMFSFAVFWFFAAQLLESSYIPLELYFEHRNYLAMVGPLIAGFWYLRLLYYRINPILGRSLIAAVVSGFVLCAVLISQQAVLWGNPLEFHFQAAKTRPESIRAQLTYADALRYLSQPELAMERLQVAHAHYPREVTIMLSMWNLACEYSLDPPYTLEQITHTPDLEYYHDDINHHLRTLLENLQAQTCEYPGEAVMAGLFDRIGQFAFPDFRKVGYYLYYSELYVYYRQLTPALQNLTRAFEIDPVATIPIRQAILAASANNYSDALVFLERARVADANRRFMMPSQAEEIARMESDARRRLQ